jgi:RimJ/RimL family protein N-acetyltransferase
LISLTTAVIEEGRFMITMPHEFEIGLKEEREWMRSYLIHPGRLLIVAEAEDELVGMLDFHNGQRQRISHRGMLGMNVRRDWRGVGVGRALLTVLLDWATLNPLIHKVSLSVLIDNTAAISLYRGMGFVEDGRRRDEIQMETGEFRDDILMCKLVKRKTVAS